ncbi:MAG TPA: TFIIB-type zinc ribbon-containing protein [Baekduia sp.]|nr:TFIIB-type zinc ribbon-containing protein [Baekduia sp.]
MTEEASRDASSSVPPPTGPGSPQDVPPEGLPIDPQTLPDPIREELEAPDPAVIDTESKELSDGVNRCPKCGSTDVQLRTETGMLVCLFCRNEWSGVKVEDEYGLGDGLKDLTGTVIASGAQNIDDALSAVMTLKCGACGAEVVVNTTTELTARCHWCRHVLTINEQIPNGAVPDAVLPFHISREDAIARIRQFVDKRRLFALKKFKQEFTPENVLGVYMPYMVVDGNVSSEYWGQGEVETRQYTRGSGDDRETYYDADVYSVRRKVSFTVDDLTIESSAERGRLDTRVNTNNIINTILPFDTKNAVKWNASYLHGYTSEKRDQDVQELMPTVEHQMLSIGRSQVVPSIEAYDRGVRWTQEKLDVYGTRWVSMYLPVWLYSYFEPGRKGGMVHYIAVNARTGETMGSVPVQQWKLLLAAITTGTFLEAMAIGVLGVTA